MAIRMRTTLILSLLSVSFGVVLLSLVIVHSILQKQIGRDIDAGLQRSIDTFHNLRLQQQQTLRREVSLLAALPVLKSLMTTSDAKTIQDGAVPFYQLSGGDLFALADASGTPVAVLEDGASRPASEFGRNAGPAVFSGKEQHYLAVNGRLYMVAAEPLYFGSSASGIRLGYVLLGYAVDRRSAEEVRQVASAAAVFRVDQSIVATTLDAPAADALARHMNSIPDGAQGRDLWLGHRHFIVAATLLSGPADPAVHLLVLASYDDASRYLTRLNFALLALGTCLLLFSGLLALYLSMTITRPLDRLVEGTRALGAGNFEHPMERKGAKEIQELSKAFDLMRQRLGDARRELLQSERLATIGQMASSISHDLRHYLSAVYANAEFLGYDSVAPEERLELLSEVRNGVRGMTDLIESLLFFSRTGQPLQCSWESLPFIAEHAVALVHAHPEAQKVQFCIDPMPSIEAWLDARKLERAIYNLVLNGCQAARHAKDSPQIAVSLTEEAEWIHFRIADNGPGVSQSVRDALFQPFVSEGKAKGIGLGLALAHKIAQEHGGGVTLEVSVPGRTVFRLSLAKSKLHQYDVAAQPPESAAAVE